MDKFICGTTNCSNCGGPAPSSTGICEKCRDHSQPKTLQVSCCERDTDGDGNCPVHKHGVEFPAGTIQEKLDNWFAYHKPVGDQAERYEKLRAAGKVFAEAIVELVPDCADRAVAIRKVRDAVMNANAAIACGGK